MGETKNTEAVEAFIRRWQGREGGQERANYVSFLNELIVLLGLLPPDPADATHEHNDYVFERAVRKHRDEGDSQGRIDLYKKHSFVLEAKQSRLKGVKKIAGQTALFTAEIPEDSRGRRGADRAWDVLMLNAKRQAEEYARALPTSHGWPPFILVCDVGHCIEVYADFSGQGKNYTQFPDRQTFRIYLEDLRNEDVRERLRKIWLDPASLDPAQKSAKVTRDIAKRLAQVSLALEKKNYPAQDVAMFLMRCLFTMCAEDVGLLPEKSFKEVLEGCEKNPEAFTHDVGQLWEAMDLGTWAHVLKTRVKKFNGEFFRNRTALPLGREEIGELRQAASYSWKEVDPSIFGTLLEQALDAEERKRLGAHYTPRAYVERLVVATIIEPVREDWRNVQATAETKSASGDLNGAAAEVRRFHDKLCETKVLDPACGTANFLYVSLELMKRLEGEVLEALLDLGGQEALRGLGSHSVDPHQFLGLEINPRAAAIAELVLWIGYLQWHFRTKGAAPEEPILRAFKNIQVKNAVLTWDGDPIPKIVNAEETYPNARRPEWPTAEFIVGNPPFIGNKRMREVLGHTYVDALWNAHSAMNESADFVMCWWDHAADIMTRKNSGLRAFGLVTTNSVSQIFQRRVIERHLRAKRPLSITMAIPDHPWTKATKDAAAVRIAMMVMEAGEKSGKLFQVSNQSGLDTDQPTIDFDVKIGKINSDLTIGVNVASAQALRANDNLSFRGITYLGAGFIVDQTSVDLFKSKLGDDTSVLRPYLSGRDLVSRPRGVYIIDLYGRDIKEVKRQHPFIYQHLLRTVKPIRENDNRESYREIWWQFAEPRREFREATQGITKYIAIPQTAKHLVFQVFQKASLPDQTLVLIALDDGYDLGVLSSGIHRAWALAAGGTLEDRPRYSNSRCFDPFPFPDANNIQKQTIRVIAEELDAHRKRVLAEYRHLTLTGLYNVLEELRAGIRHDDLDEHDRRIFDDGLVLIMKELHDRLDVAVAETYRCPAGLSHDEILLRLVALNKERSEEERRGLVRWLRPDFQIPRFGKLVDKQAAKEEGAQVGAELVAAVEQKPSFPSGAVEQTAAIFPALAAASAPLDANGLAAGVQRTKTTEKKVGEVLAALARLGHVTSEDGKAFALRRVA